MPVEFSEYRCKKKYKAKRQNFPVFRLLLLFGCVFAGFHFGIFAKIVNKLPLPGNEVQPVVLTWDESCRSYGGTPFELKGDLGQCSWMVTDSSRVLPNSFLRYLASIKNHSVEKLHWVALKKDFWNPVLVQRVDSLVYLYLNVMLNDSSFAWVDAQTGCRFPGLCPRLPMDWQNIPISEDFDFEGQDWLLSEDVFLGPGEAPVHPILPGVVLEAGEDSTGEYVLVNHGNNVTSRMSGIMDVPAVGDTVDCNSIVGRLAPKDSAAFFLTVRRNGLFVRWNDFYRSAHLASDLEIAKFKKQVGF